MNASTLPSSKGEWHQRIWRLTWPVILANITIPLVGATDVMVMGLSQDHAYIAAVTVGTNLFSAIYWLLGFLRMSTTALSAQAFGSGQSTEVASVFARAASVALVLGCLIVVFQGPISLLLFRLFDTSEQVANLARAYYDIRIFGAPALLLYLVSLGLLFGLQRTRDALWLSISMNITNVVLDVLFVPVLGFGIQGVATATIISEWGAAGWGMWFVWRGLKSIHWQGALAEDTWIQQRLTELFSLGGNLILRTFFVQLPFLVGAILAAKLGDVTLAAHGVLMQLFFFMAFSLDGFAHTAETLSGFAYGAKQSKAVRQTTVYCTYWALGWALLIGAVYLFAGGLIVDQFSSSAEVRSYAREYLVWLGLTPLLCIWAFLFDGVFIGTTHISEMRNAMIASALLWAATLWLSFDMLQYHAVWLSMCCFMLARSVLLLVYYPRIEKTCN